MEHLKPIRHPIVRARLLAAWLFDFTAHQMGVGNMVSLPHRGILGPEEIAMLARVNVTQLPVNEAAQQTGLHPDILIQLVRVGALAGNAAGELSMCDLGQAKTIADQLRAARKPVDGAPILVSDAAKRYGFSAQSINRWVHNGWVAVIQEEARRRVNEGDIAFAHALAELQGGHIAGRAVFPAKPRSGRPRKSNN